MLFLYVWFLTTWARFKKKEWNGEYVVIYKEMVNTGTSGISRACLDPVLSVYAGV